VDQSGLLWLVWEWNTYLLYAVSLDGGRNFTPPVTLFNRGRVPAVEVLPNGFVGIAYARTRESLSSSSSCSSSSSGSSSSSESSRGPNIGDIVLVTEDDDFVTETVIAGYEREPSRVVLCRHGSNTRLFVGWIDGEIAKYAYSDDDGATWSAEVSLGTYSGLSMIDLPTGHLLAVVEHHHRLWGMVSRDQGVTWDDAHAIPEPEAAVDPVLFCDSYNDVIVFSSELDVSTPLAHTYIIRLRDLPFFAYTSEVLDIGGVEFLSSSSSCFSSSCSCSSSFSSSCFSSSCSNSSSSSLSSSSSSLST